LVLQNCIDFGLSSCTLANRVLVQIPDGHVWLEGDNPFNSSDSRSYGPLPVAMVHGRVFARIWPLSEARWINRSQGRPTSNTIVLNAFLRDDWVRDRAREDFKAHADEAAEEEAAIRHEIEVARLLHAFLQTQPTLPEMVGIEDVEELNRRWHAFVEQQQCPAGVQTWTESALAASGHVTRDESMHASELQAGRFDRTSGSLTAVDSTTLPGLCLEHDDASGAVARSVVNQKALSWSDTAVTLPAELSASTDCGRDEAAGQPATNSAAGAEQTRSPSLCGDRCSEL
jgi:hypothetical protein